MDNDHLFAYFWVISPSYYTLDHSFMDYFKDHYQLLRHVSMVETVFKTDLVGPVGQNDIVKYFADSFIGYKLFHSRKDALHMALNYNGIFHRDGYYQQVREISEYIPQNRDHILLELGCGKGFNIHYLASKHPQSSFHGVDISDRHIASACKKTASLTNAAIRKGDFHRLEFENATFDAVYELEAACYTDNPADLLKEIYRSLKPNGVFILYEAFRQENFDQLTDLQKKAAYLAEKSMAVNKGHCIHEWMHLAEAAGFIAEQNEDITYAIIPNVQRFHRLAKKYFKYPALSKFMCRIFPETLLKNSIAGLLLIFTTSQGIHRYHKIVLRKKSACGG